MGPNVIANEQQWCRRATVFAPAWDDLLVRPDGTVPPATRVQFVRPLYDLVCALRTLAGALEG